MANQNSLVDWVNSGTPQQSPATVPSPQAPAPPLPTAASSSGGAASNNLVDWVRGSAPSPPPASGGVSAPVSGALNTAHSEPDEDGNLPDESFPQKTWRLLNTPLTESLFGIKGPREGAGGFERGAENVLEGLTSPVSLLLTAATLPFGGEGGLIESAGSNVLRNTLMGDVAGLDAAALAAKGAEVGTELKQFGTATRAATKAGQLNMPVDAAVQATGMNYNRYLALNTMLKDASLEASDFVGGNTLERGASATFRKLGMTPKDAQNVAKGMETAMNVGFTAQQGLTAIHMIPKVLDLWKEGKYDEANEALVEGGVSGLLGAVGAKYALAKAGELLPAVNEINALRPAEESRKVVNAVLDRAGEIKSAVNDARIAEDTLNEEFGLPKYYGGNLLTNMGKSFAQLFESKEKTEARANLKRLVYAALDTGLDDPELARQKANIINEALGRSDRTIPFVPREGASELSPTVKEGPEVGPDMLPRGTTATNISKLKREGQVGLAGSSLPPRISPNPADLAPGRDQHGLAYVPPENAPAEVQQWDKDEAGRWLGETPRLEILSQTQEHLDPAALKTTQPWASDIKLKEWERKGLSGEGAPPISVVRTPEGDFIVDGVHRATQKQRAGEKVPAAVYTVQMRPEAGEYSFGLQGFHPSIPDDIHELIAKVPSYPEKLRTQLAQHADAYAQIAAGLTPEQEELVGKLRDVFDNNWTQAAGANVIRDYVENYVQRIFGPRAESAMGNFLNEVRSGRFDLKATQALHRVYGSAFEGMMRGHEILAEDPVQLAGYGIENLRSIAANQKVLDALRAEGIKAPDGKPVVIMKGSGDALGPRNGGDPGILVQPNGTRDIHIDPSEIEIQKQTGMFERHLRNGDIRDVTPRVSKTNIEQWLTRTAQEISEQERRNPNLLDRPGAKTAWEQTHEFATAYANDIADAAQAGLENGTPIPANLNVPQWVHDIIAKPEISAKNRALVENYIDRYRTLSQGESAGEEGGDLRNGEIARLLRQAAGTLREPPPEENWILNGASQYAEAHGHDPIELSHYLLPDFRAKEIADAYTAMKHEPDNPRVKASYDALKAEIAKQWDYATKKMGVSFEPWKGEGQPYANSAEMMKDVRDNKHLSFFQGGEIPSDHPLAEKSGDDLTYNDKLRAVLDLFGHAMDGFQFGARGEENAWNAHSQMFSEDAIPALTTETKGQNSWVNYGPQMRDPQGNLLKEGDPGWIPPKDRAYAEQKAGLLPDRYLSRLMPGDVYATPNRKTLTLVQALKQMGDKVTQRFIDVARRLDGRFGTSMEHTPALGVYRDVNGKVTAEPSVLSTSRVHADPDDLRALAALRGKLAKQESVLTWHEDAAGPELRYTIRIPDMDAAKATKAALKAGLDNVTAVPNPEGGVSLHIINLSKDAEAGLRLEKTLHEHFRQYDIEDQRGYGQLLWDPRKAPAGQPTYDGVLQDYERGSKNQAGSRNRGVDDNHAAPQQSLVPPELRDFWSKQHYEDANGRTVVGSDKLTSRHISQVREAAEDTAYQKLKSQQQILNGVKNGGLDPKQLEAINREQPERYVWHPQGYVTLAKKLTGWNWVAKAEDGTNVIVNGEIAVHPEYAPYLKNALGLDESPLRQKEGLGRITGPILRSGGAAKSLLLSFSPFHMMQEALRGVMLGVNPLKVHPVDSFGLDTIRRHQEALFDARKVLRDNPESAEAKQNVQALETNLTNAQNLRRVAANGGTFTMDRKAVADHSEGLASHSKALSKIPVLGKSLDWYQDFLFNRYMPSLKADAALRMYDRYQAAHPEWSEDAVAKATAEHVNNAFGGQDWRSMGRAAATQDWFQLFALAPDWLESEMRFAASTLRGGLKDRNFTRQQVLLMAAGMWGVARTLNMLTSGHPHLESPFGVVTKDKDGRDVVYSIRTMPTDILHMASDPEGFLKGRMSPFARAAQEAISGRDAYGRKLAPGDLWVDIASNMAPIPFQAATQMLGGNVPQIGNAGQIAKAGGFTANIYRTEAQKLAANLSQQSNEQGPMDETRMRRSQAVARFEDDLRSGRMTFSQLEDLKDFGNLPRDEVKKMRENVQLTVGLDPETARMVSHVSRMGMPEALQVWDAATPGERHAMNKVMFKKMKRYITKAHTDMTPEERATDPTFLRVRKMAQTQETSTEK